MKVSVLTIFPELIEHYCGTALVGRAQERGALTLEVINPRDYTHDPHRSVDDAPFGGGAGMLMKAAPIFEAVEDRNPPRPLVLLAPHGRPFSQRIAHDLAELPGGFSLLCGRYEGVDYRVEAELADDVVSLGDFVLAGGELGALCVIEAVTRLLPFVLGNSASQVEESFEGGLLEYPQYTRPANFRGWEVPAVLLEGNHREILRWRRSQALLRTAKNRPDLLASVNLGPQDAEILDEYGYSYLVNTLSGSSKDDARN